MDKQIEQPSTKRTTKYTRLLSAAKSLCNTFASNNPEIEPLLSHFSTTLNHPPIAFEHGHSSFAPFIGREFKGRQGITEYFNLVSKYLSIDEMSFSDYFVDEREMKVSVRGYAKFMWKESGVQWEEYFVYTLDYVEEEGVEEVKVERYQVWADTGALYRASLGEKLDFTNFHNIEG